VNWRSAAVLLLPFLLSACSTAPLRQGTPEAAYLERSARVQALGEWEFNGRLSMDDGIEGGSGQLHWRAGKSSLQLDFRGALGRGAWRLGVEPGEALLERADGTSTRATSVDRLIQDEIGWHIPVNSLRWWVLGVAGPGGHDLLELDESGRVRRLLQQGWTIEFDRYQPVGGLDMPRRMEAVSGPYRVKLAVRRWVLGAGDEAGE
jgi:outer membrane lipoprotein LolB